MFQVSGAIGMILFYLAWCEIFYRMRGVKHGPIVSWTVAYACSVLWQHLLNRTLVWTDLQQGYWESLGGMCVVYFFSLILSSVLNVLFVEVLSIAANFAFFVTAVFTGAVNYVVIAKCAIGDDNQESKELEDKEWEERDIVVDMATNMVSGIQLPSIEMPMPAVELWGKKIQQVTKYHKKWANDHQV
jgi:putative flippase GtrA